MQMTRYSLIGLLVGGWEKRIFQHNSSTLQPNLLVCAEYPKLILHVKEMPTVEKLRELHLTTTTSIPTILPSLLTTFLHYHYYTITNSYS